MKRCVMVVGFWLGCLGLGAPLAFGYVNGLGRNAPREVRDAYETFKSRRTGEQQALLDRWYAAERGGATSGESGAGATGLTILQPRAYSLEHRGRRGTAGKGSP